MWALYRDELMPMKTAIVGYARSPLSVAQLRTHIGKYIKLKDDDERRLFDRFLQHSIYVQGKYDSPEDFKRLTKAVEKLEHNLDDVDGDEGNNNNRNGNDITNYNGTNGKANNRLFYLALPPSVFEPVTKLIHDFCMSKR